MKQSKTLQIHSKLFFLTFLFLITCKAPSSGDSSNLLGLFALNSFNQANGPTNPVKPTESPNLVVKINSSLISEGNTVTIPSAVINTHGTSLNIEVFNSGTTDLEINSVFLSNGDTSQFSMNTSTFVKKIKPSANSSFSIALAPTTDGNKAVFLFISSNDQKNKNFNFSLQGTAQLTPAPSIMITMGQDILQSGNSIDIGGLSTCSSGKDYSFKIKNYGTADLNLTGAPIIQISGTNANLFSISQLPTTILTPESETDFKIRFTPSGTGTKNAGFLIQNNDSSNSGFAFNLTALETNPEINLSFNSNTVASGNNQYVGYTRINSGNFNLSFKIENTGSGNLILSGSPSITLGGDTNNYGILQPSNSIISSTATFFNLIKRFSSVGLKTSTISIPNDDCDENPYTIMFSGIGFSDTKVADTSSWSARRDHVLLNYNNTLWILGGSSSGVTKDVYSSNDGLTWSTKTSNAAWGKRTNFSGEVFNGKMWVLGGSEDTGSSVYVGRNDVWNSTDGITWTQVTTNGGWAARTFFATATFNNKIWIFGGRSSNGPMLNDVWYSNDGITWTQATANAGWEPRDAHKVLVYNNKLWLIGGFGGTAIGKYQDVWSSPDGVTWSRVTSNANFSVSGLSSHNAVVFNNKMWVINGFSNTAVQNYIFQSSDGIQWEKITPLWTPRDTSASTVFNGKIWMLGGFDYNANRLNDIWTFWDQ